MLLAPRVRVGAHVELFKADPETGEKVLVHTSRPCEKCGGALDGVVVTEGGKQVHLRCPQEAPRGS